MTIVAGGRLEKASLFQGTLSGADVSMQIERGSLQASYTGRFDGIDPAIPFADPRWKASLTGSGSMTATARELLIRDLTLADYDVAGSVQLRTSTVRDITFDRGRVDATLHRGLLTVRDLEAVGAALEGRGSGTVALDDTGTTRFDYDIARADAAAFESLTSVEASGAIATRGRVEGPWSRLHFTGEGSVGQLDAFSVKALTVNGTYDATLPGGDEGSVWQRGWRAAQPL